MATPAGPTHEEMRDRLLQKGSSELREEYARLGPRRDAIVALFRARQLRKLTQYELAQRAGVSQGVISRLESGGHSPKLETLERIARAMDFRLELKLVDDRERGAAASGTVAGRRRERPAAEMVDTQPTDGQSSRETRLAETTAAGYELLRQTADAYRDQGYEVSIEEELDFLPGFRADLLARKGDQVRVIEIKPRSIVVNSGALDQLARAIKEQPGWSLDVVLGAETEQQEPPRAVDPFIREHVQRRLDEAEQVLDEGHPESAFLLACLAFEARIGRPFDDRGRLRERFAEFARMSEPAAIRGMFSAEERERLIRLWELRNAIVHGYHAPEFNEASVRELIDVVRELGTAAA